MDASHIQIGAVILQGGRPIFFYSRKLNYGYILPGQKIRVYTVHKNLTYKNFHTDCVMCKRLILEEYGPELLYTPGHYYIVADSLSHLDMTKSSIETLPHDLCALRHLNAQLLGYDHIDQLADVYLLCLKLLEFRKST
jgi:hypothetical protein